MFRATLQWNRRSSLRCSCRCYQRQRWDASAVGCVRHHRNLRTLKTRLNSDDAYVEAALALDVISCLLANKRIPVCWYLAPLSNSNQVICKAKLRRAAVLQLEINLKKQVWKDWHHQRISAYLSSICFYIFVRTPPTDFQKIQRLDWSSFWCSSLFDQLLRWESNRPSSSALHPPSKCWQQS